MARTGENTRIEKEENMARKGGEHTARTGENTWLKRERTHG